MKPLYLSIVFICFVFQFSSAQYHRQYFDGADTMPNTKLKVYIPHDSVNTWQIGRPQKAIFDSAATLPNALVTDTVNFYPVNDSSQFVLHIPVWPNWGIMALQWKQKLDFDSAADGGVIEFSVDTGHTWQNIFDNPQVYNFYGFQQENEQTLPTGEKAFSGTDTAWRDIWLCYDMTWLNVNTDTVLVRFTLRSDSVDNQKEGWLIDNMMQHMTIRHTIAEIKTGEYLTVYPNPASDKVFIQTEKLAEPHIIESMQLINAMGQVVDQWENVPTKYFIRTASYNNGIYVLKIKTNIKTETKTVVIKHD